MNYKIHIHDRKYSDWSFFDENNQIVDSPFSSDFHPSHYKLYHNDVFQVQKDNNIHVVNREIDENRIFAGVILLSSGQTYGRTSNGRLLYKCVCHEANYPELLVPYDAKIGFSKAVVNKYVIFSYKDWSNKHPNGILRETLGDVSDLNVYYEYTLHAKSIHFSLTQLNKHLKQSLKTTPMDKQMEEMVKNPNNKIIDKTSQCYVFSIDPQGSNDLDDAFSCQQLEDNPDQFRVCVYISNVFLWIEQLQIWDLLSQRVSTVYFPDKKRTMLPSLFSEDWFSLLEKKERIAFTMEIIVNKDGNIVDDSLRFYSSLIKVRKNFVYDEDKLLANKHYKKLEELTMKMDANTRDSHDVVSFWMIQMNVFCAKYLADHKTGIFRQSSFKNKDLLKEIQNNDYDQKTKQMLSHWNNVSCKYTMFEEDQLKHEIMDQDHYVHITSPIRRLVDVLNQICFYKHVLSDNVSDQAIDFLEKWSKEINFLNTSMKSIQKVQNECNLLYAFHENHELQKEIYSGVIIQKQSKEEEFSYLVYIQGQNTIQSFKTRDNYNVFEKLSFKMYLFEDEHVCKRKIRISAV